MVNYNVYFSFLDEAAANAASQYHDFAITCSLKKLHPFSLRKNYC